jgi:hypothetical protein
MAGLCAEKALVQHRCRQFNDQDNLHIFIVIAKITLNMKILLSRGFSAHKSGIYFIQIHFLY